MSASKTSLGLLKLLTKIALPVLALFVGISSYKALKSDRPTPPKPQKREVVQPVRTSKITLSSYQPSLKLYGEIQSGRKLELRTLVGGKVLETGERFRNGALVKKGDMLLSIDPFSYKGAVVEATANIIEARARLKENTVQINAEETSIIHAQEQLQFAKRDLERARKLMRKGSVTRQGGDQRALIVSQRRQTLDSKRANLAILRAKAEQQRASINSLEWRLQQARRNQKDTVLKAPFSGYINEINANVGKLLNVNDRVAVLLDSDWMEAVFTLSDQQYGRLLESSKSGAAGQTKDSSKSGAAGQQKSPKGGLIGRHVKVTWKLGDTALTYRGIVERTGAQISSESGGISVYARLINPSQPLPVRAGAFVDIEVPDRMYHEVARLPQTSLYGRSRVYVVGPDGRLRERIVKLQAIDGEFALVSGDLADGERVVVTRMSVIGGGMKVQDLDQPSKSPKKTDRPGTVSEAMGTGGGKKTSPVGSKEERLKADSKADNKTHKATGRGENLKGSTDANPQTRPFGDKRHLSDHERSNRG